MTALRWRAAALAVGCYALALQHLPSVLSLSPATAADAAMPPACAADCNGDAAVGINELIACVNDALGSAARSCPACDGNGDGAVSINELIAGVNAALESCPATPTPTAPAVETPTDTPGATTTASSGATPSLSATSAPPATSTPLPVTATRTAGSTATAGATRSASAPPASTPLPSATVTCDAIDLGSGNDVSAPAGQTLIGAPDRVAAPSCLWSSGSESTPDRVYRYVAPANGTYEISVALADPQAFIAALHVRRADCHGPEIAGSCVLDGSTDGHRDGRLTSTVSLAEGTPIAIVVEGRRGRGGDFALRVSRRLPDLRAEIIAPAAANAGGRISVSAVVTNTGDEAAGPFAVDFFYAPAEGPLQVLGVGAARCTVAGGLAARAQGVCQAPDGLAVPRRAAGEYRLVAHVDAAAEVEETDEGNNGAERRTRIDVVGSRLVHQLFRASEGTTYELLSVEPILDETEAEDFRITTLAADESGVLACHDRIPGGVLTAVSGAARAFPLDHIQRTALLQPPDAGTVAFDATGQGELMLGGGQDALRVRAGEGGVPLFPILGDGGGVANACVSRDLGPAVCDGQSLPSQLAFGIAADPDTAGCAFPQQVTIASALCREDVDDGLLLSPGDAIVFVHDTGLGPYRTAVAGFGVDRDGSNSLGCTSDQIVEPISDVQSSSRQPYLTFVQALKQEQFGFSAITSTSDGRFVYVVDINGAVATFSRHAEDGSLALVEILRQGTGGVSGLTGARAMALSPGDNSLYVVSGCSVLCTAGDDTVVAFSRDADSGRLRQVRVRRDQVGGVTGLRGAVAVTVSPDGRFVYVLSDLDAAVVAFERTPATGDLAYFQTVSLGELPPFIGRPFGGHNIAVSADGTHVYVARPLVPGVTILERDATSDTLSVVDSFDPDFEPKAVLTQGDLVHIAGDRPTGSVLVSYARDPASGLLAEVEERSVGSGCASCPEYVLQLDGDGGSVAVLTGVTVSAFFQIDGRGHGLSGVTDDLPYFAFDITRDGRDEYAVGGSETGNTISPTRGDPLVVQPEVTGLEGVSRLCMSPDGRHLYAGRLERLERDRVSGRLSPPVAQPLPAGIGVGSCVAISPDGRHVYASGATDDGEHLLRFVRDSATGELAYDGIAGLPIAVGAFDAAGETLIGLLDDNFYVFRRQPDDGRLTLVQTIEHLPFDIGRDIHGRLVVSRDARSVYLASPQVLLLSRDPETGLYALRDSYGDAVLGPGATAWSAALSPDGRHLYVASISAAEDGGVPRSRITTFERDRIEGTLHFLGAQTDGVDGVDGINGAPFVSVTPDGTHLVVGAGDPVGFGDIGDDAIAVFERDPQSGGLDFVELHRNGVGRTDGLDGPHAFAIAPDGTHLYVASDVEGAIAAFRINRFAEPVAFPSP